MGAEEKEGEEGEEQRGGEEGDKKTMEGMSSIGIATEIRIEIPSPSIHQRAMTLKKEEAGNIKEDSRRQNDVSGSGVGVHIDHGSGVGDGRASSSSTSSHRLENKTRLPSCHHTAGGRGGEAGGGSRIKDEKSEDGADTLDVDVCCDARACLFPADNDADIEEEFHAAHKKHHLQHDIHHNRAPSNARKQEQARVLGQLQNHQILLGMVTLRDAPKDNLNTLVDQLMYGGIRFVYFSGTCMCAYTLS